MLTFSFQTSGGHSPNALGATLGLLLASSSFLAGCGGPLPQRATDPAESAQAAKPAVSAADLRPVTNRAAPLPKGIASPIPVQGEDPQLGDRYAPVTLVVFYNPSNVAMARTLARLSASQDRAKLRIVHKLRAPLGAPGVLAEAAMGVHAMGGSGACFEFLSRASASAAAGTDADPAAAPSDAELLSWVTLAGLANPPAWLAAVKRGDFRKTLEDNAALARKLSAAEPVAIYANGQLALGSAAEDLTALIERETRKAALRTERGTVREDLYAEMTQANLDRAKKDGGVSAADDADRNPMLTELKITDPQIGDGATVKRGDQVSVHYTGMLQDGTVFDSSRPRGEPFTFEVGRGMVIKGWDRGLVGMRVGGKRRLVIPPGLGYGSRGAPPKIPGNATLMFDVELMSIK